MSSSTAASSAARSTASATGTSSISVPGTAAAGGLSMTQPPATAAASYYKIASAEYVTFGWNLTSLYVTPKSLTVIASCSDNSNTYPIGPMTTSNGVTGVANTIPGTATAITWNPYDYEAVAGAVPLAVASYTLKIWDERGDSSGSTGGYMSPYSGTKFALYRPQAYTPLASWVCSTCSSASRFTSSPSSIAILVTLLIVLLSGWGFIGNNQRRGRA